MSEGVTKSSPESWFVYLLRCSDGSFYTGITTDPGRREKEHNESVKGAKYTMSRRPVTLVYLETVNSRAEASRREYAIKQMGRAEKLALIEQAGHFELHLEVAESHLSVVELLSEATGFSRTLIKTAMQKGAVWLERGASVERVRRAKKQLNPANRLHFYYDGKVLAQPMLQASLVCDCGDYSVWVKPHGMLSQGSKWADHTTLIRFVEKQLQRACYPVHRLDRATSGLMMVAHGKKMARILSDMFATRAIGKCYQAIVRGDFNEEAIEFDAEIDGKAALSRARRLAYDSRKDCSLLEVEIATGRKHQIRRHLAESGFPLVGDRLYGEDSGEEDLRLMAVRLDITCPVENRNRVFSVDKPLGELAVKEAGYRWE